MSKTIACNLCGKTYKRAGSLKRHLNICEIICNSKKTKLLNQEEKFNAPSLPELYMIVQKLVVDNEKLKREVSGLKNKYSRRRKKINIIEWLNENQQTELVLNVWKNNMTINNKDLDLLFNTDFETCIEICLLNNIQTNDSTIKAFSQNKNIIYVKNTKWEILSIHEFKKIISFIQRKLMCLFSQWSKTLTENKIYGSDNMVFLKNQQKIFGGYNLDKTIKKIYNKIYREINADVKNLIEYQISF
uniref:C2H2-type domain-containing protein n=1 Tax=viral metagenome TaxID=1070528 RepID=A0A6C0C349_9ZZZZ